MRVLHGLLAACLVAAPAAAQSVDAPATQRVEMLPGLVRIIQVDRPVGLIIIGNPAIADTQVLGEQAISVTALAEGNTSIVLLDDDNRVIVTADLDVVSASRGLGRQGVNVRSFGQGRNEYVTHTYFCGTQPGQAACSFDGSKRNFSPPPVISTGPIVTPEGGVEAAPAPAAN